MWQIKEKPCKGARKVNDVIIRQVKETAAVPVVEGNGAGAGAAAGLVREQCSPRSEGADSSATAPTDLT